MVLLSISTVSIDVVAFTGILLVSLDSYRVLGHILGGRYIVLGYRFRVRYIVIYFVIVTVLSSVEISNYYFHTN